MNNQQNMVERIEANLAQNKSDTKTYATYEKAVEMGKHWSDRFNASNGSSIDVDFIPVYLPTLKRWTPVFNLTRYMAIHRNGVYLGFFATAGYYSI